MRLRIFILEAPAPATIAIVKTIDFMGRRVAEAMLKGVTEEGKKERLEKGQMRDS
jgi:hypothetical protein